MAGALGRKLFGKASLASDVTFVRKTMLKVLEKWRDRLRDISAIDERLDMITTMELGSLESAIRDTSIAMNNDWLIISSLVGLVNSLLGYDWFDEEIHRHVFYFRDKHQENFDHDMMFPSKDAVESLKEIGKILRAKYALVNHLRNRLGLTVNEVAKVMGLSEYYVRNVLARIAQYEQTEESSFADLSNLESTPLIYDEGYRTDLVRLVHWRAKRRVQRARDARQRG